MRILVTGANGYLGALLSSALEKSYDLIRTSRRALGGASTLRLDITDRVATKACIVESRPDVILHTAAIANIAACEASPAEAMRTNVLGTENIVEAANACAAQVILISSLAARDLSTVYGQSKHEAEARIRGVSGGYEILQLSMTFGLSPNRTSHRPFNKILSTLRSGFPDTYDNCWKFQPTDADHLRKVIEQLLPNSFRGRTLPVTTVEACTMHQLVSDVLAPMQVKAAALYPERMHQHVDPSALTSQGLPSWSYASMVTRLRRQLLQTY